MTAPSPYPPYPPYVCSDCGAEGFRLLRKNWKTDARQLFCVPCLRSRGVAVSGGIGPRTGWDDYIPAIPARVSDWAWDSITSDDEGSWWLSLWSTRDADFITVNCHGNYEVIYMPRVAQAVRDIGFGKSVTAVMFDHHDLTPPDLQLCQTLVPTNHSFMTLGGRPGTRERCANSPVVVATENNPGPDGKRGSMSLCKRCLGVFKKSHADNYASFRPVPENRLYPDVEPDPDPYQS